MPRTALRRTLLGTALLTAASLTLVGCSGASTAEEEPAASTITVDTNLGEVEVPVNPSRVVALDNTSFATVAALGITPVAVPKPLLPSVGFDEWLEDDTILDAGLHSEPNLEAVNEAEPDLIIGGYRFSDYQDDLSQIATTIDIAPSDETGYIDGLIAQTETLGAIFDKEDEAAEIVAAFEEALAGATDAATGQSVFLAVASGGKIDNGAGRIGRLAEPLDLVNVLDPDSATESSVHNDSGLAPETIAELNPEWVIVLDRDAATADGDFTPAKSLIESNEAFANTTFVTEGNVIYLDPNFYLSEGIQAYTEAFQQVADQMGA